MYTIDAWSFLRPRTIAIQKAHAPYYLLISNSLALIPNMSTLTDNTTTAHDDHGISFDNEPQSTIVVAPTRVQPLKNQILKSHGRPPCKFVYLILRASQFEGRLFCDRVR